MTDAAAILAQLGYSNIAEIAAVSGGRDTALFRVELGDRALALRVFRPDQLLTSQAEVRAMSIARAGGVPVPEVVARGIADDRPALLLSWCPGRPLVAGLMEHPERARYLGAAAGKVLARINGIDVPAEYRNDSWLNWALPDDEPLRQHLQVIARNDRLLHLDFHPLNVMTDGVTITGVLDWANARSGDPRADLARAISILRLDAGEVPTEYQPVLDTFVDALLAGYEQVADRQHDMPLFYAYAGRLMLRDLADRLHENPGQRERIEAWVNRFIL